MNREYFIENDYQHNLKLYKLKNAEADCWYIYDRNIHQNKRGADSSNILLVNSKDWSTSEHPKSFLENCIYVVNYLETLTSTKSVEKYAIELLEQYKDNHQETVAFKDLEIRRNQYLKEKGYGAKKMLRSKTHRSSHCWMCKNNVNNKYDFECGDCGWIICGRCAACKQGGCK